MKKYIYRKVTEREEKQRGKTSLVVIVRVSKSSPKSYLIICKSNKLNNRVTKSERIRSSVASEKHKE